MTSIALPRHVPVELTGDARFRRRIVRLSAVSAVALGGVWGLAVETLDAPAVVTGALLAGWILMPAVLVASLLRPRLRYALVLPATLVSLGLLAICLGWLPSAPLAAAGWVLMTGGVGLGGGLGLWLWYRLLPVPAALDDPFSAGRWSLVGLHVGLVAVGFLLAATALA